MDIQSCHHLCNRSFLLKHFEDVFQSLNHFRHSKQLNLYLSEESQRFQNHRFYLLLERDY